ncbi:DUF3325 family protein [Sphingopyxis sp. H080]|uniref:DUF3325 family protein n=1 Tax=Sphingopyxis sp. H080 TaxID=1759069 RepID=UPI0009E6AD0C
MIHFLAIILALCGFALLAISMPRHQANMAGRKQPAARVSAVMRCCCWSSCLTGLRSALATAPSPGSGILASVHGAWSPGSASVCGVRMPLRQKARGSRHLMITAPCGLSLLQLA